MGLTSDESKRIGKMSDLRTRPAKTPQDENNQIDRLMSNEIILQKIIQRYGNLDAKGGRDAIGIVVGVHNKTIDKLMAMRRTGGILMSNVYGALELIKLDAVIDPYATATSAKQLNFSSLETPQNQTRDITKILKKKLPVATGNDELVFPFDKTLFTAPLTYVVEASLPISLGCICVLGDTNLLQDEATTDPKASTFPVYSSADSTANFYSSLDTPTVVLAKWKATMSPAVAYAGFTQNFGHAALSFDSSSGKYVASFIASADYGICNNGIYYEVDRYSGSNASKINLGLNTSTTLNVRCGDRCEQENNGRDSGYGVAKDKCDIEITRNPEGSSSINLYNQIYKPVIRICGGAFRLPTTIGHDSFFSGNIIGRAQNGDPYNVIDNIVTLNTELISSKEVVNILSCTATSDSWCITTDNKYNALQVVATPAYNPTSITALNKASPVFITSTSIRSSDDWQVATGWRISYSSIFQNNASFNPNLAFDRNSGTYWACAEQAYSTTGVGSQYLQIEYPDAVKMSSYKIDPSTRYTGAGAPIQWTISASNNNSTFINIETFQFNSWQQKIVQDFFMSVAHIPYKYWRITITLIKTSGVAIHTTISDISFIPGWSMGMTSLLSAQPVDLSTFKLILGNSYGVVVSMLDTPIDWQFNLLLIKSG
ncbi:hypothetical protein T492DRAFT_840407 [Pavlovales sp. CCMP2436]|nr:hypothetical protein T492DRAFT_840407 [Pavlovales sp. CCMP2436]